EAGAEAVAQQEAEEALRSRLSEEEVQGAIAEVITKMSMSAGLLDTQLDPGLGTQRIQEDVLARLDQLISESRRQQSSSSQSSSRQRQQQQQQQQQQSPGPQQQQQQQNQQRTGEPQEGDPPAMEQQGDINEVFEENRAEW